MLPARRSTVSLLTDDGVRLAGEWSLPVGEEPRGAIVLCHPLPTAGGSMDSHLVRKAAWRLPALAGIAVLRFNFRGTRSQSGVSEGTFEGNDAEGHDLAAALAEAVHAGMPDPWAVGWSFGTDVILRWGDVDPVSGVVLLSPPGRWSSDEDVARWGGSDRPLLALVPELDDFARPDDVRRRFAGVPHARVVGVEGARHLWVGERYARIALDAIAGAVLPGSGQLPTTWEGPMESWSDLE